MRRSQWFNYDRRKIRRIDELDPPTLTIFNTAIGSLSDAAHRAAAAGDFALILQVIAAMRSEFV